MREDLKIRLEQFRERHAADAAVKGRIAALEPLFLEALPLSLEEIFIYELGGEEYAVRDIVL